MNRFYPIIFALLFCGCSNMTIISKRDCLRLNESELRKQILFYTPVGSTFESVIALLKSKGYSYRLVPIKRIKVNLDFTPNVKFENKDEELSATIQQCDWWPHLFLGGTIVDVEWLFNSEQKLKDVQVVRWQDGV